MLHQRPANCLMLWFFSKGKLNNNVTTKPWRRARVVSGSRYCSSHNHQHFVCLYELGLDSGRAADHNSIQRDVESIMHISKIHCSFFFYFSSLKTKTQKRREPHSVTWIYAYIFSQKERDLTKWLSYFDTFM